MIASPRRHLSTRRDLSIPTAAIGERVLGNCTDRKAGILTRTVDAGRSSVICSERGSTPKKRCTVWVMNIPVYTKSIAHHSRGLLQKIPAPSKTAKRSSCNQDNRGPMRTISGGRFRHRYRHPNLPAETTSCSMIRWLATLSQFSAVLRSSPRPSRNAEPPSRSTTSSPPDTEKITIIPPMTRRSG